jgi:hypothetical protein
MPTGGAPHLAPIVTNWRPPFWGNLEDCDLTAETILYVMKGAPNFAAIHYWRVFVTASRTTSAAAGLRTAGQATQCG